MKEISSPRRVKWTVKKIFNSLKNPVIFLASWRLAVSAAPNRRLTGGAGCLVVLLLAVISAGCGGRAVVKPEETAASVASPTATPVPGFQIPSLVDIHGSVTDQEYQSALAQVGAQDADRRNLDSFYALGQYQYNHSNLDDALKTYQKMLLAVNADSQLEKAQYMVGQIYYDKKDYLPSLAAFQTVLQKYANSTYAVQSRRMMEFMLGYSLGLQDLKSYVANYPESPLYCYALFQLGSREAQSGLPGDAVGHLKSFVQGCPQSPSAGAAGLLLQSLQSQQLGKTWKIGVLAPKSGRYKGYGDSVLNGVALAIEQAGPTGGTKKTLSWVIQDTGSGPIQAVQAFQALTKDNSLDAVIGPVVPSDIAAVAPMANEQRVVLISPSVSRDGLSTLGPYLFSNGMTNEMQGRAMAKFAVEKLGFKRLAVLAPDDSYGDTLSQAFQKTVESMGASIVGSQTYPPDSSDFRKQLLALGGEDPQSVKEDERENNRRLDELKYALKKEVGKILLKAKEQVLTPEQPAQTPALVFVPFAEALSNTTTPSVVKDINDSLGDSLKEQTDYVLRNDDLVKDALKRLPVEFQGTTLTVSADQWWDVAQDLQASMIVAGRVIENNPPGDWSDHPTWDFSVYLEAFQLNAKKTAFVKIYQNKLPYSIFKPASLLRTNTGYQALYLPAHAVEIPSLVSQVHFYDLNPVFLGGHLWDNDAVRQEGGKDLEGSYYVTGFYQDSTQGSVKDFTDAYLKKFAKKPDFLAAQAYDAARLLLKAMANAETRDDIHNNLLQIRDFDGVSGKTTFGGHGEAEKVVPVLKIQDGKVQQVQ